LSDKLHGGFQAILFDLDGTLLVANIDFAGLRNRLGVPDGEPILDWIETLAEDLRSEGHRILNEVEAEAAGNSRVNEGAADLIRWVAEQRIPFGILTRNTQATWEVVSSRFPFLQPDIVITRELAAPKPQPESLLPFLEFWGLAPEEIVHVGDYRFDLELAEKTGMHSILLHPKGENPFDVPCHKTVRTLGELLEYLKEVFSDREV